MVEYLMDIKHYSYDQILADTVSEERTYAEMIKWNGRGREIRNVR
jgi:hypothetical protein